MSSANGWFHARKEVVRTNAAESILVDLQAGISEGILRVGERLPSEVQLAQHYGVSRPVVREALRSAQALGLTQTRTGSGTYVMARHPKAPQRFDNYSTRNLLEARPAIEVPSARLAAKRRSYEQAEALLEICHKMEEEKHASAWVKLDSEFHVSVAAASGNEIFSSLVSDTRHALSLQSEVINMVAHRREPSNEEHLAIAQAIHDQDHELAARLMNEHLDRVSQVMHTLLEDES